MIFIPSSLCFLICLLKRMIVLKTTSRLIDFASLCSCSIIMNDSVTTHRVRVV